jgi:uncharacterized protein (TIGR02145 family)
MTKNQNNLKSFFLLLCVFLFLTSSCSKSDDDANTDIYGAFSDSRDGYVYKTVKIGNQIWLSENMRFLPNVVSSATSSEGNPYYYVYDYEGTNVTDAKATFSYATYGVLYNYEAAMTCCPDGWHLPNEAEWTQLLDFLGGESVAGGKLKEMGLVHWNSPNTGATNEVGFTALPGGFRNVNGGYGFIGGAGSWWSSTMFDADRAISYNISSSNNQVFQTNYLLGLGVGMNVRCIKN